MQAVKTNRNPWLYIGSIFLSSIVGMISAFWGAGASYLAALVPFGGLKLGGGIALFSSGIWMILSILLPLGVFVYQFYVFYGICKDINTICEPYEEDSSNMSPSYFVVFLLSLITCNIYMFFWVYKQGNRLQYIGKKYGVDIRDSGSALLLFWILGIFTCSITTYVGIYKLFKNLNMVSEAYVEGESYYNSESITDSGGVTYGNFGSTSGVIRGTNGEYSGQEIVIQDMEHIILGRSPEESNLVVNGKKVSRKHCSITYHASDQGYYLTDYSSNGTYKIDGTRLPQLTEVRLGPGTQIYLGNRDNVFQLG